MKSAGPKAEVACARPTAQPQRWVARKWLPSKVEQCHMAPYEMPHLCQPHLHVRVEVCLPPYLSVVAPVGILFLVFLPISPSFLHVPIGPSPTSPFAIVPWWPPS